jgi:hypothetical protein
VDAAEEVGRSDRFGQHHEVGCGLVGTHIVVVVIVVGDRCCRARIGPQPFQLTVLEARQQQTDADAERRQQRRRGAVAGGQRTRVTAGATE